MSTTQKQPKNILFILTDDQGAWAMHCAGNDDIHTPNLDRLAASGVRYENFYCVSPVCSPARASILTGKIPSAHGVHDWLDTLYSTRNCTHCSVVTEIQNREYVYIYTADLL